MNRILAITILLYANSAYAINDYYDCLQVGSSLLGWNSVDKKYEAGSSTKSETPNTVKLTDLNSNAPYLSSQSTIKLTRVSSSPEAVWFIEITPGSTVVTWTLFPKNKKLGAPKTLLISSKSYDIAGAFNFTTIYECKQ
jgi:hypothetical protein